MRFLRNLSAEVILVVGVVVLVLLSLPFILVEILFHAGILGWALWAGAIWLVWKKWDVIKGIGGGGKHVRK